MPTADVTTLLCGETLRLLPERALFWPRARTLVIADPHFGKAAAFRAGGIPLPGGTTAAMLARLDAALDRTGATTLLILGDLLHARSGRAGSTLSAVDRWRDSRPELIIRLVRGNHDLQAGDPPASWDIDCLDEPVTQGPFCWLHQPPEDPATLPGYPIAGHVHPAVALAGNGHALTLPCFYFGRDFGLLPAFGEFTGTAVVRPRRGEQVYVIAGDEVINKGNPAVYVD